MFSRAGFPMLYTFAMAPALVLAQPIDHDAACAAGEIKACETAGRQHSLKLGMLRRRPDGDPATVPTRIAAEDTAARKAYGKGCELGSGVSCWGLARLTEDLVKRNELLKKGCDLGFRQACDDAAQPAAVAAPGASAATTPPKPAASVPKLDPKAATCETGNAAKCFFSARPAVERAKSMRQRKVPETDEGLRAAVVEARRTLDLGCQMGDPQCCRTIADLSIEPKERLAFFDRACQLGSKDVCLVAQIERERIANPDWNKRKPQKPKDEDVAPLLARIKKGESLRGANLSKLRLQTMDLSGQDLTGANLDGAFLNGADLHGATLDRASLVGTELDFVHLHGASLQQAKLDGASLIGADLEAVRLKGATLRRAVLRDVKLLAVSSPVSGGEGLVLDGVDLTGAELSGTIRRVDFRKAKLTGAKLGRLFEECHFGKVDLSGADLSGSHFVRSEFSEARLDGVTMPGASFFQSTLVRATLRSIKARGASFGESNLIDANFSDADLGDGNLSLARVSRGTSFAGANLCGINPSGFPPDVRLPSWAGAKCAPKF